ncbi:MAG: type II secretion system F family protein [Candidatus Absconditabacteria bacterium]
MNILFSPLFRFFDSAIAAVLRVIDRDGFSGKQKILFFRELSYLLKGGISVMASIELIIQSSDNMAVRSLAASIFTFLNEGKSLSYAFNRLPEYFDQGDFSIVKAGEMSGTLPSVLSSLAEEYSYIDEVKNKYIGAMMYPTMLFFVAIVSVVSLFVFVLPGIFSIADSFQGVQIPLMTQILRNFSLFLTAHWVALVWFFVGIATFLSVFFSTETGNKFGFSFLLNVPLFGKLTRYYYLVKFCRYMKLMLGAGMNYVQTFTLLKEILTVPAYQDMIQRVLTGIKKGENIYSHLKLETELIPADVAMMIKVGEHTATLPKTLDNVLVMYDAELQMTINGLSKVIEPVMLIFIGGVVVSIAMAVFGLILQIMDGASM